MKLRILIASVLSLAAAAFIVASASDPAGLVVHEWGTFLAMNGSDGISLDGMYHEEHALPAFVHSRSKDQLRRPMSRIKGETPVIYFYTPEARRVEVEVDFPTGLWTQWYPQATTVKPGIVQAGSPPQTRDGSISWNVIVRPPNMKNGKPPATKSDALWNYARDVDAAYVTLDQQRTYPVTEFDQPGAEWERFIFYRGLGEAPLPVQMRFGDGRITASTTEAEGLNHLFVLRVENGRGAYTYTTALRPDSGLDQPVPAMDDALPLDQFVEKVSADVASRLVASGLYQKEALAMVNTWKSSYFKTEGVRVLFVLPQSWTDKFIPMRITPQPDQLVRVMVGRVELLDRVRESRAEQAIGELASADAQVRERAFEMLRNEGRYVEPIVRRASQTSADERVRTLARRLLLTDFVTELRTAFTDASTGETAATPAVYVQAQLASLLREVGLTAEARKEGEAALALLSRKPEPAMNDHLSRQMFRALASAHEGAGHDAEALDWYRKFVEFGSQAAVNPGTKSCTQGCHQTMGPRDVAFFKDWYAGRKFGELAVKTGDAPRLIATSEASGSRASQLRLAYLYGATAQNEKARKIWETMNR